MKVHENTWENQRWLPERSRNVSSLSVNNFLQVSKRWNGDAWDRHTYSSCVAFWGRIRALKAGTPSSCCTGFPKEPSRLWSDREEMVKEWNMLILCEFSQIVLINKSRTVYVSLFFKKEVIASLRQKLWGQVENGDPVTKDVLFQCRLWKIRDQLSHIKSSG